MVIFWSVLALMALLAAGFVIWPLWRKQQSRENEIERESMVLDLFNEQRHNLEAQLRAGELEPAQFEQLQRELELSLLADSAAASPARQTRSPAVWGLWAVALLLPLAALSFYWQRGAIEDVQILQLRDQYFQQQVLEAQGERERDPRALLNLVDGLTARLEKQPDNMGNRYLLARAYMQQGAFVAAVQQYSHILQHGEPPANIIAELAQAIFLAAGNRATPEVEALVQRALELDPNENTALGLAGISAFEQGQYQAAIQHWTRAVQLMGPNSAGGRSLQAGIERASQLLAEAGGEPSASLRESSASLREPSASLREPSVSLREPSASSREPSAKSATASADAAEPAALQVQVSLADTVSADPGDTVFVYARAWQGPKMPLAIARMRVAELPALVTLNESMAMAPGMTIRSFPQLEVVARISSSGDPIAASGDWQATAGPVMLGESADPFALVIASQLP